MRIYHQADLPECRFTAKWVYRQADLSPMVVKLSHGNKSTSRSITNELTTDSAPQSFSRNLRGAGLIARGHWKQTGTDGFQDAFGKCLRFERNKWWKKERIPYHCCGSMKRVWTEIETSSRAYKLAEHTQHTTVLLLFWNVSGTTRVSRYQKGKTRQALALKLTEGDDHWSWQKGTITKCAEECKDEGIQTDMIK